jgi:hypothetical protein
LIVDMDLDGAGVTNACPFSAVKRIAMSDAQK